MCSQPDPSLRNLDLKPSLGLGVLFGKLQQGVIENRQVLTIARLRADAEEAYGQRLSDITPAADKLTGGFARDDGATVRKACYHISQSAHASIKEKDLADNMISGLRWHADRDARCLSKSSAHGTKYSRSSCQPVLPMV